MRVEKAISLTQPWASLVEIREKWRETRGWSTNFRGWVAIHAAKGFPLECRRLCRTEPYASALLDHGYTKAEELPLGCVIAVANIVDCIATRKWAPDPATREHAFGDYRPAGDNGRARYSFGFLDVHQLKEPMPCRGALGFWTLPRPITWEDLRV